MKSPNQKKIISTESITDIKEPVTKHSKKNIEEIPLQAAKGDDDLMSQQQPIAKPNTD